MIWDHICMVNFKAAYRKRINGPEAEEAEWRPYWTTGRHGCGSWKEGVACLKENCYQGAICLPAEYTDMANAEKYVREDLAYLKELFVEA